MIRVYLYFFGVIFIVFMGSFKRRLIVWRKEVQKGDRSQGRFCVGVQGFCIFLGFEIRRFRQSLVNVLVEAVFFGRFEVDICGFYFFSFRVSYIFESFFFGVYYLVVDVSDQFFGGLLSNQVVSRRVQEIVLFILYRQQF